MDLAQGIGGGSPHVLVSMPQGVYKRFQGPRVTNLSQRLDGSYTNSLARIRHRGHEELHSSCISDLAQRPGRIPPLGGTPFLEEDQERAQGRRVPDLAQRCDGGCAHRFYRVVESGNERLDGS
jgi:hypothetical protein